MTPEHASYQLRFTNTQGQENPQPIRHQIEVTRDVAPEIRVLGAEAGGDRAPLESAAGLRDFRPRSRLRARSRGPGRPGRIDADVRAIAIGRNQKRPALAGATAQKADPFAETIGAEGRRRFGVLGLGRRQQAARGQSNRNHAAPRPDRLTHANRAFATKLWRRTTRTPRKSPAKTARRARTNQAASPNRKRARRKPTKRPVRRRRPTTRTAPRARTAMTNRRRRASANRSRAKTTK